MEATVNTNDTVPAPSSSGQSTLEYSPDIVLDFSKEEKESIRSIFPNTKAICVAPPYLIVRVKDLRPKPWLLTIAGPPLVLTTSDTEGGYPHKRSGIAPPILSDMLYATHKPRENMRAAAEEFRRRNFRVHSITIYRLFINVELVDDISQFDRGALPGRIANKMTAYAKKDERSVEEC